MSLSGLVVKVLLVLQCICYWAEAEPHADSSGEYGGISTEGILGFMRDGWQTIRDLVPELRDPETISNITHAYNLGRLEYVKHSYMKLMERKVTCDGCTPYYNVTHYETDVTLEFGEFLFQHGKAYLDCCITRHNADPASTHREVFPLLQVLNTHRYNKMVHDIATSYRIGLVAAQLLQHHSVRLYQSAIFIKNNMELNQETIWHNDLNMIPLDTGPHGYLTFWCPVTKLEYAKGDSMLRFAHGSHRDMTLRHWYQPGLLYNQEEILARYRIGTPEYLDVGDCTVHHGWNMHAAVPQPADRPPRMAVGFGYVIADATVMVANGNPRKLRNFPDEDEISYKPWLGDLHENEIIDHPLLPVVFPASSRSKLAVT